MQHANQSNDGAAAAQQQAQTAEGDTVAQQQQQQPSFVQEAPSVSMQVQQQPQQQLQAQHDIAAAVAAAAAAGAAAHGDGDLSMEPPGNLPGAAAAAAAAAAAGGSSHAAVTDSMLATATRQPSSASPISLLAKAIGAGGVSASDIPVLPPAGAAVMVKQEPGVSHPAVQQVVGLNSPVFPPPGSLSSPGIGVGACASPAQAAAKWSEIDPEAWFEGDGSALGALGDIFKNDTSIFQSSGTDQHDSDLVTAW